MWSKKHDSAAKKDTSKKLWFLTAFLNPHKEARRYSQNPFILLSPTSSLTYPTAPAPLFHLSFLEEFLSSLSLHTCILTLHITSLHDHCNTKSKRNPPGKKRLSSEGEEGKNISRERDSFLVDLERKPWERSIINDVLFHPAVAFFPHRFTARCTMIGVAFNLVLILFVLPPQYLTPDCF